MKKISCNIVRDVLPLYLDDVVSNDTKYMVEEHLKNCESCREEAALLKRDVVLPTSKDIQLAEAGVLKNLKIQIRRKRIAVSVVAVIVAVIAVVTLCFALTVLKSYIPYRSTQFEITEIDGKIYASYHGKTFGGSVAHDPISVEINGEQKEVAVFYCYKTPLDSIKALFDNGYSSNEQLIYLGNANEIDLIYYGEFDLRNPDTKISTIVQDSELIWSN